MPGSDASQNTSTLQNDSSEAANSGKIGLAGGIAIAISTNTAHATLAGTGTIDAGGNVSVHSLITDGMLVSASGEVTQSSNPNSLNYGYKNYYKSQAQNKKNAGAVALNVGLFNNDSEATIASSAVVNAGGSIQVNANTNVPIAQGIFTSPANIESGLEGNIPNFLNNDLGANVFFTSWAQAAANGTDNGVAFSVDVYVLSNKTLATIASSAQINPDENQPTAAQDVTVDAETDVQSLNLSGVDPTLLLNFTKNNKNLFGTSGSKAGVGGALLGLAFINDTQASIGSANVMGHNVNVQAATNVTNIGIANALAKAGQTAIDGTATVAVVLDTTTAYIASGGVIDAGGAVNVNAADTLVNVTVAGGVLTGSNVGIGVSVGVNVVERNTSAYIGAAEGTTPTGPPATIDAAGGVTVSATSSGLNLGLALAGSFINTNQSGESSQTAFPSMTPSDEDADVTFNGDPISASEFQGTGIEGTDMPTEQPESQTGTSIAGDVVVNYVNDTTLAYINEPASLIPSITGTTLTVSATNNTNDVSVAGSVASVNGESEKSTGFGGSLCANAVISTTQAFISGGNIQADQLLLDADRGGFILSLTAGGSGAPSEMGTAVAGSVSLNLVLANTDAYVTGSTIALTADSHVDAADSSLIWSVAGAGAYGGRGGYGASVAVNLIGFSNQIAIVPNQPATTEAYINGSTITMTGGTLQVSAQNQNTTSNPRIIAITGSLGIGGQEEGNGGAGMVSVNVIKNDTEAYIQSSSVTQVAPAPGMTSTGPVSLEVQSNDTSGIISIGGAVAVANSNGVGFGAAIGYNETRSTIEAALIGTTVNVGGTVSTDAESNAVIGGVAVGVGAGTGEGWAAAGSIQINQIIDSIDSHIAGGSSVTAAGNIAVTSRDNSLLVSVTGGGAGTSEGKAAIGAAISYNRVSNGLAAYIDSSNVNSTGGSVEVTAISSPLLIGIGAAGAGTSQNGIGGAGTLDINSIANTIDAYIESSTVSASGDVEVSASEASSLDAVSLAAAGSSQGSAIGAAIAYNYVGGAIDPADPNVISYENGTVAGTMNAIVSGDDTTNTSDVSAYIDSSSVTAGGQVLVVSGYTNPNSLAQPGPVGGATQSINTASGVAVTGNALHFTSPHGLATGQAVVYHSSGGPNIGGLVDGQVYYVIKIDDNTIKLAATYADAINGIAIDLGSAGNDGQAVTPLDLAHQLVFDPSHAVAGNSIVFPASDGLSLGEEVAYDDRNGTPIGGLVSGRTYFVIPVSATTIELASSLANALNGFAVALSYSGASAQQSLTPTLPTAVLSIAASSISVANPLADTISVASNSGLATGDAVVYRNGGGNSIGGLKNDETYYVIVVDATHVQLATSLVNAQSGVAIPLTSTGTGTNQTLQAMISQVSVGIVTVPLPTPIGAQITSVTAAGAGGKNIGGAGAVAFNFIRMNVNAHISNTPSGETVQGVGGVSVLANDTSQVGSGAGSLGVSTNGGAAINASVGVNDIRNSVTAEIAGAVVGSSAGAVAVAATETARDYNVAIGGGVGAGGNGNAFGGSFAFNFIQNTVGAAIESNAMSQASDVTAYGTVSVLTNDMSAIATLAGNVGVAPKGFVAIAVASAVNDVADQDTATIDNSMVNSATGDIDVNAAFGPPTDLLPGLDVQIAAIAVSGSGAGEGAGAGSVTLNWIKNTVAATIKNVGDLNPDGPAIQAAGHVKVTASDSATIDSLAGAIAIAGVGTEEVSGAVGASVAYDYLGGDPASPANTDGNSVTAAIENVTGGIQASQILVQSSSTSQVNNITVGGAGAGTFALGGAVSINTVIDDTVAKITGSSGVVATGTGATAVQIMATDNSTIQALAGGIGVAIATNDTPAVSIGASAAVNGIYNTTDALVNSSNLTSAGGVSLSATATPAIKTLTIGGAVSGSNSSAGVALAGAGSGNTVQDTVEAEITNCNGNNGITASGGPVSLDASDSPTILAGGGGVGIAAGFGQEGGVGVSVGISVATNNVQDTVTASISNSVVGALGNDVSLSASDTANVQALTIGGAVGGGDGGEAGVGVGAAAPGPAIRSTTPSRPPSRAGAP